MYPLKSGLDMEHAAVLPFSLTLDCSLLLPLCISIRGEGRSSSCSTHQCIWRRDGREHMLIMPLPPEYPVWLWAVTQGTLATSRIVSRQAPRLFF